MSQLKMTDDTMFRYKNWKYRSTESNPTKCIKHFLQSSNKTRVDILQYKHDTNYCYGMTESQLKTGNSGNNDNWSSLDLRPGYIVGGTHVISPAHQDLIDMQEQIEKDTPATEHCHDVVAGDPLDPEYGPCTCYLNAADAINSTAMLWSQYFVDKTEYQNYLVEKAEWDQDKSDEKERLKAKRGDQTCGTVANYPDCNKKIPTGDWEKDHYQNCGVGSKGWTCRYSSSGINKRLQTWQNNHPKPTKVNSPGSGPSDIPSSVFQCCTNIVQGVTVDDTAEILQNCSQNITLNEEEREEQNQLDEELQEKLTNTTQGIEDLDDTSKSESKSNTTIIIAIVAALVFFILVGFLIWYFYPTS